MSTQFIKKNIKLSLEFGRYISGKPDFMRKIPNKGYIFFTIKGDKHFNQSSRSLIENARTGKSKIVEVQKQGKKWEISSLVQA